MVGVYIACSLVEVQVNFSFGKWNMSLYTSHIATIEALSSLFNWSNLSWSRKLVNLQSLFATAESVKVNETPPSSSLSRSTRVVRPSGPCLVYYTGDTKTIFTPCQC